VWHVAGCTAVYSGEFKCRIVICPNILSDRVLLQQSLTVEPHNAQLLRALKSWSENAGTYKEDMGKMTLRAILDTAPEEVSHKEGAIKMIQGFFRGANSRHVMNAGKLKLLSKTADPQKKGNALTKLNARLGTLFECEAKTVLRGLHPVVLNVRADWAGRIRFVSVFDVRNGVEGKLPLPSSVFAPCMEYSSASTLRLSISCRQQLYAANNIDSPRNLFREYYMHSDKDVRADQFTRPVSREVVSSSIIVIPPKGACEGVYNTAPNDLIGHQILCIQFTNLETGAYTAKQFVLAAIDSGGSFVQHESARTFSPRSHDQATRQVETMLLSPRGVQAAKPKSVLESLSLAEVAGASAVYTNVPECLVACGCVNWEGSMYLYRVNNRLLKTYVSVYLVSLDLSICITMPRIHVDRTANIKRFVQQLLINLGWCQQFEGILKGRSNKRIQASIRKALRLKSGQLMLVHCRLFPKNSRYCACVEFFDPLLESILEHQLSILDRSCFPDSSSQIVSPRAYIPISATEISNDSIGATEVDEECVIDETEIETAGHIDKTVPHEVAFALSRRSDDEAEAAWRQVTEVATTVQDSIVEQTTSASQLSAEAPKETIDVVAVVSDASAFVAGADSKNAGRPPRAGSASAAVIVMAASTVALATQCAQVSVSSRPSTPQVTSIGPSPETTPLITPCLRSPTQAPSPSVPDSDFEYMDEVTSVETPRFPPSRQAGETDDVISVVGLATPSLSQLIIDPVFSEQNPEDLSSSVLDAEGQQVAELHAEVEAGMNEDLDAFDEIPAEKPEEEESVRSPFKRQDTNGRLTEQVLAKKKISTIKTINFLEHERMRLEAFEFLYSLGMSTLIDYLRDYSLTYLQNRAKQAILQIQEIAEQEERRRELANAQAEAEAEQQRQREEAKAAAGGKKTPPAKLRKGQSERGLLKKSPSTRGLAAMSSRDITASEDSSSALRSRKSRSAGSSTDSGEDKGLGQPMVSTKDVLTSLTFVEDADQQSTHSDENSEVQPAATGQGGSVADTVSSTLKGTVSTVSKGEARYMNSILDAMKARDLKSNNSVRAHDFTYKQQLLLRQPLDVDNLPEYAYESAQGLILALQAQDREYEDYIQRKAAKEMMKLEQLQLLQQREVAYSVQREKELARLRIEKKGSLAESSVGTFGPPKQNSPKRSSVTNKNPKLKKEHKKLMSSTVGPDQLKSDDRRGSNGLLKSREWSTVHEGVMSNPLKSSSWTTMEDAVDFGVSGSFLDDDNEFEDTVLPPLPLNSEFSQTLFCETSAVGSATRTARRLHRNSDQTGNLGSTNFSAQSKRHVTTGSKMGPTSPSRLNRQGLPSSFEKSAAMIAEGHDPMAFMNIRDRGSSALHIPGEELCQRLLETHRTHGYIPTTAPDADTGKFCHQWVESIQALLVAQPSISMIRKGIAALQKSHQLPLSKLEAFCALASVGGKVPDALGKLMDNEFRMEVSLACKILPVNSIVAEYEGLFSLLFLDDRNNTVLRQSRGLDKGEEQRTSKNAASHSSSEAISPVRTRSPPSGPDDTGTGSFSKPATANDDRLRIKGLDATKKLPHLNMLQSSHAVRTRSTEISIIGAGNPLSNSSVYGGYGTVDDVKCPTDLSEPSVSGLFPSISALSSCRTLPAVTGNASSKMFVTSEELSGWRESAILPVDMVADHADLANSSSTFSPGNIEGCLQIADSMEAAGLDRPLSNVRHEVVFKMVDSPDKITSLKGVTRSMKSVKGPNSGNISRRERSSINPNGAINVERLVDHVSSPQLLVMSRKDAYRAMEDETLARSANERFRGMSSQGKIDRRMNSSLKNS
jgi:hypothetical protein